MRKNLLLILIFFITTFENCAFSQTKEIESFHRIINDSNVDSVKINALLNLAEILFDYDINSIKKLSYTALYLSNKSNWEIGKAKSQNMLALYHCKIGEYTIAKDYTNKSRKIWDKYSATRDSKIQKEVKNGIAFNYSNSSLINLFQSNQQLAFINANKALSLKTELKNKDQISGEHRNIGLIYNSIEKYQDGLKQFKLALKYDLETKNSAGIASDYFHFFSSYAAMGEYSLAYTYFKKSKLIYEKLKMKNNEAKLFIALGKMYLNEKKYSKSLDCFFKAESLYKESGFMKGQAKALYQISSFYSSRENYPAAIAYLLKSEKIFFKIGNKKDQAEVLGQVGALYNFEEDYSKSLEYYYKSLTLLQKNDKLRILNTLGCIGYTYTLKNDLPKALSYTNKALKMAIEEGSISEIAYNQSRLGNIYALRKDYESSINHYNKALYGANEIKDHYLETAVLSFMGNVSTKTGKYNEAEEYLKKSLHLADSLNIKEWKRDSHKFLYQLYDTTNRSDLALNHYEKFILIQEKFNNTEIQKKQSRLTSDFDAERKEFYEKIAKEKEEQAHIEKEHSQYLGIFSFIILVFTGLFLMTRTNIPLRTIDFIGFVGVLLFFQFLEVLLHPYILHYSHGSPYIFMVINIGLVCTIKPMHHFIEKRLISYAHNLNKKKIKK